MTSSTRDGWERLVAAVLKREQFRQLCRQDSISTVSSEGFSERTLSFSSNRLSSRSVPPSPLIPHRNIPPYQGGNTASSSKQRIQRSNLGKTISYNPRPERTKERPIKWKLFPSWFKRGKIKEKYLVHISEHLRIHLGLLRRFSLHGLQVATENFTNQSGYGAGFAKIYKGQLADGSKVAVIRHLDIGGKNEAQQMLEKIEIDSYVAHPNVLTLLGFCITPKDWLLVYPLMVNRSVALHLGGTHEAQLPINWPMRKGIALGSAKGLAHLHEECDRKILHRDIKAANILLNEDFEAVVGEFALGILAEHDASDIEDTVCGTTGHIAPEYLTTGKFSEKNDVFGYGVFLLELITGQRAFDLSRLANDEEFLLLHWVKGELEEKKWRLMIDADCGDYIDEEVEQMLQIALVCTHCDPEARPKMSEVVRLLEVDVFSEKWEKWSNEAEMYMDAPRVIHRPQKHAKHPLPSRPTAVVPLLWYSGCMPKSYFEVSFGYH